MYLSKDFYCVLSARSILKHPKMAETSLTGAQKNVGLGAI